jgi:hypothetical protein
MTRISLLPELGEGGREAGYPLVGAGAGSKESPIYSVSRHS